jgi:putative FmdB family regulatory protein
MDLPYYRCEDCGHEFAKTELTLDVEDEPLSCPVCGGLDIALVETGEAGGAGRAA